MKVQTIETKEELKNRIDTGALKINDDWKGYFFRGDDSLQLIIAIETIINELKKEKEKLSFYTEIQIQNLEDIITDIRENTLNGINTVMDLFQNSRK